MLEKNKELDTVLFVDDEVNILNSIKRELFDESFEKLFANSGFEALKMIDQNEIAVIVTDMRMPKMSGLELLTEIQKKNPDIVRIILTGYSQISTLISAINTGQVFRYITKPWQFESDFIPAIRQAIEYHHLIKDRKRMVKQLKSKNLELNKRNFEIQTLLNSVTNSNSHLDHFLNSLTREIIPFVEGVVKTTGEIMGGLGSKSIVQFKLDMKKLNERGVDLVGKLKKVEKGLSKDNDPKR